MSFQERFKRNILSFQSRTKLGLDVPVDKTVKPKHVFRYVQPYPTISSSSKFGTAGPTGQTVMKPDTKTSSLSPLRQNLVPPGVYGDDQSCNTDRDENSLRPKSQKRRPKLKALRNALSERNMGMEPIKRKETRGETDTSPEQLVTCNVVNASHTGIKFTRVPNLRTKKDERNWEAGASAEKLRNHSSSHSPETGVLSRGDPKRSFTPYTLSEYRSLKNKSLFNLGGLGPARVGGPDWLREDALTKRRKAYDHLLRANNCASKVQQYRVERRRSKQLSYSEHELQPEIP